MEHKRKCICCGELKDRSEMLKITANHENGDIIINPNSLTFGRSAYLCYNNSCIESAFKKNKLEKFLKASIPSELKGQLLNELRNNQNK